MFPEYIKLIESKINNHFDDNKSFENKNEIIEYINDKSFNENNYKNWYEFYFWIRDQARLTMVLKEKKDLFKDFGSSIVVEDNLIMNFQIGGMFNLLEKDFGNIDGQERLNNGLRYKLFCGKDIGSAIKVTINKNKKLAQKLINEIEEKEGRIKHAKTVLV